MAANCIAIACPLRGTTTTARVRAIKDGVELIERELHRGATVGVGIPGTISRITNAVKNANSTWMNGRPFDRDLGAALQREVRCANDANCLAVSEATDGAVRASTLFLRLYSAQDAAAGSPLMAACTTATMVSRASGATTRFPG